MIISRWLMAGLILSSGPVLAENKKDLVKAADVLCGAMLQQVVLEHEKVQKISETTLWLAEQNKDAAASAGDKVRLAKEEKNIEKIKKRLYLFQNKAFSNKLIAATKKILTDQATRPGTEEEANQQYAKDLNKLLAMSRRGNPAFHKICRNTMYSNMLTCSKVSESRQKMCMKVKMAESKPAMDKAMDALYALGSNQRKKKVAKADK